MTRKILATLSLVFLLTLAACGGGAPDPTPEGDGQANTIPDSLESTDPFRVAVVMPSTITDVAWSQALYDSLVTVQEEMGGEGAMEIAYTENMFNVADAAAAIRDYAADGYDLVIAHGTQYTNAVFETAPDFPETSFAYGTATDNGSADGFTNIFAYEANAQEGGYVNGVIAAMLSQVGQIGVVGPVEAGDAKLYIDGFVAGVAATNPDADVSIIYTGSFGDTALAAESANTLIANGADVLTGSAQQVVGAIGAAQENGVYWLGTQSDQTSLAPDYVVANQLYNWTGMINDIIAKQGAGEFGSTTYVLTLTDGLEMEINDLDAITDEIRSAAEEAESAIEGGEIEPLPSE